MYKKALIFGISGQDGSYLAKYLISKKYKVFGTSRFINNVSNLNKLKILKKIKIIKVNPKNFLATKKIIIKIKPDEIYYFSGISSILDANNNPKQTFESITIGTLNILESIKQSNNKHIKIFFAGSTECYGNLKNNQKFFDENSEFSPVNIYSFAKTSSYNIVKKYREFDKILCCTGILSNHESPLRSNKYISKKIIEGARKIANGKEKELKLGNINTSRDWGWAPEYVEVMWKILQQNQLDDYIIASGKTTSLIEFINIVFKKFNLDWKKYIIFSKNLKRKSDIKFTKFNVSKIQKKLKWRTKYNINRIIDLMIKNEY